MVSRSNDVLKVQRDLAGRADILVNLKPFYMLSNYPMANPCLQDKPVLIFYDEEYTAYDLTSWVCEHIPRVWTTYPAARPYLKGNAKILF